MIGENDFQIHSYRSIAKTIFAMLSAMFTQPAKTSVCGPPSHTVWTVWCRASGDPPFRAKKFWQASLPAYVRAGKHWAGRHGQASKSSGKTSTGEL